jgi:hypothetical protein
MKKMTIGALAAVLIASMCATAQAGRRPATAHVTHGAALLARVNVTASEFKFVLSKKTAKRGIVVFRVTNAGAIQHDFKISGPEDEAALSRSDRHAPRHVPAQRPLRLPVHGPRPCRGRNEGSVHNHVSHGAPM